MAAAMLRREFRAMNTDCLLILRPGPATGAAEDLGRAEATVHAYEARFSRFLSASDLSRLNSDARAEVAVSPELAAILGRALEYARLTSGIFDPVVLADLQAIGYDRSFEQVQSGTQAHPGAPAQRYRWRDVHVDSDRNVVRRPPGALVDLGGVAKGAAADAAHAAIARHAGALVDLGGDIRTSGCPDDAEGWFVGMENPEGNVIEAVSVADAAVATSSVRKRRWLNDGAAVHHLIDPRTGLPAASGAAQCSAIADTAEHAEVAAKVGLIVGASSLDEDHALGRALGVRGIAWITRNGEYVASAGWKSHAVAQ